MIAPTGLQTAAPTKTPTKKPIIAILLTSISTCSFVKHVVLRNSSSYFLRPEEIGPIDPPTIHTPINQKPIQKPVENMIETFLFFVLIDYN